MMVGGILPGHRPKKEKTRRPEVKVDLPLTRECRTGGIMNMKKLLQDIYKPVTPSPRFKERLLKRLAGLRPMKATKPDDCQWAESCNCDENKSHSCMKCKWYWFIDSGYGYCKALPEHMAIAWCRDVCSLYGQKQEMAGRGK